jgi:hypothetical protein
MRRTLLMVAIVLGFTVTALHGQLPSGCSYCKQWLHGQPPTCPTCPGPGGCACDIDRVGQYYECVPCGCCNYIPGTGGVCYDSTGGACNNENCTDSTAPVTSSDHLKEGIQPPTEPAPKKSPVSGSTLSAQQIIEESPWLDDSEFQSKIQDLAPYLGHLVWSLQDQIKRRNHVPAREGRTISGYIYFRDDYPANFSVMKAGNIWRLELSPDPKNPDGANVLEISGRSWKMLHHIHHETDQKVIARGTY